MNNNILIFGSKGFLAQLFLQEFIGAKGTDVNISNYTDVEKSLDYYNPTTVINCAAKTGIPNIDWCESHKDETFVSNVIGPVVLSDACVRRGIFFVHLSSGCIYYGDNNGYGFSEEDKPNFCGSWYSYTKILSEKTLSQQPILIVRLRMPFNGSLHPKSLITKLINCKLVLDVQNSMTYIPDFINAVRKLIELKQVGIFNITNPNSISPYEIMIKYAKSMNIQQNFKSISDSDLDNITVGKRSNCILNTNKINKLGINLLDVHLAIDRSIDLIGRIKNE